MLNEKINKQIIQTPEGITFSLVLAGPVVRGLAWMIDLIGITVVTGFTNKIAGSLKVIDPDFAQALAMLSYFAISIGYGILLEWRWQGQTLGKRLMRLRVMDAHGLKLQFGQVVIRNLLRFVDMLPAFYLLGGITCLLHRHSQRLGDIAANTIVVRTPKIAQPDLDQLLSLQYNSFREHTHLVARLRQKISPEEASLILQALMRRDLLDDKARTELFHHIASHCQSLTPFPPETTHTLSDEQYVRNVADVLFRSQL